MVKNDRIVLQVESSFKEKVKKMSKEQGESITSFCIDRIGKTSGILNIEFKIEDIQKDVKQIKECLFENKVINHLEVKK